MKIITAMIVLSTILICFSCEEKQIKIFADLEGKWKLEKIEFLTENGQQISDSNRNSSVTFTNVNAGRRDPVTSPGTQFVGAKQYDFTYFANDNNKLNMYVDFKKYDRKLLPIEFLGLSNVYNIVSSTNGVLILSVDSEYDNSSKKLVKNLRLYFTKDK